MDVFISYSHRDEGWKNRVTTFMQCLREQEQFEYAAWHDGDIRPGEAWERLIRDRIDQARVAILLVSPDFLSSDFIMNREVPWLLEQQTAGSLALLPVIVRPCPWEAVRWLSRIQLFPEEGAALSSNPEHVIEEQLKELTLEVGRLIQMESVEEIGEDLKETRVAEEEKAERPPDNGYRFLEEEQVRKLIDARRGPSRRALRIFNTTTQRTWFVTTPGRMHCVLDSHKTYDGQRLIQWDLDLDPGVVVRVDEASRGIKHAGLVGVGKRRNWLYSHSLHPHPRELEAEIKGMIGDALLA